MKSKTPAKTTKKPKLTASKLPAQVQLIERRIYFARSQKVMSDLDLAELYGVETRVLIQAVKRNSDRFPEDFMFQLTPDETESLRSQFVISNVGRGGRRYSPYVFTEQGVAMLSSVLHSKRAIQVNIAIMRAFVKLRDYLSTHKEPAHQLEQTQRTQKEHTGHINAIWKAIQQLIEPPLKPKRRIGFGVAQ